MANSLLPSFPKDLRYLLTELRHDLHRHPELSLQEVRTVERLQSELAKLDLDSLERVAGTGLVARIPGRDRDAKPVAIRGDMDALPILEETGAAFASVNDGVMHACGHDMHAAWTVGAAHLLAADRPLGNVVVLLQPAEETAEGAPAMIRAGAIDGVAAIFGAHIDMRFEVGTVVAQSGNVAASADEFEIVLAGRGSHAARPHEGNDPVVAAATLITSLQTIVSRRLAPGIPAVVTVGTVEAGTATNVIPENARLTGTVRAADQNTRERLHTELRRIATGVANTFSLTAHTNIKVGTPPLVNAPAVVGLAQTAVRSLLGDQALAALPVPNLGGEDFAFYLEKIPGCFIRIGGRGENQEAVPAHSSKFLPDDGAIAVGAAVLAELARMASAEFNR